MPSYNPTIGELSEHVPYDQIFVWSVSPNITDFALNAYYQFCRWKTLGALDAVDLVQDTTWNNETISFPIDIHGSGSGNGTSSVGEPPPPPPFWLIKVDFDCYETMKQSTMGTGNLVQIMYLLRYVAAGSFAPPPKKSDSLPWTNYVQFDLQLTCRDANMEESTKSLVLPWLMGRFPSERVREHLNDFWYGPRHFPLISKSNDTEQSDLTFHPEVIFKCNLFWGEAPVGWMIPMIRHDLRWMALRLIGLPRNNPDHPSHAWVKRQQRTTRPWRIVGPTSGPLKVPPHPTDKSRAPLIPNVEIDDVVIHFRCGDIMTSEWGSFRFLKFKEYADRIDESIAQSIGIITQPFGNVQMNMLNRYTESATADSWYNVLGGKPKLFNPQNDQQARPQDGDDPYRATLCYKVTTDFVTYLQERFPNARVSLRNGPTETVALAYARLVMAQQSFASADSSFSIFPVLASFGTGFHMYPFRGMDESNPSFKNQFFLSVVDLLLQRDEDTHHEDGTVQFMHINRSDVVFVPETLALREEDPKEAFLTISEWFRNDTFVFPHAKKVSTPSPSPAPSVLVVKPTPAPSQTPTSIIVTQNISSAIQQPSANNTNTGRENVTIHEIPPVKGAKKGIPRSAKPTHSPKQANASMSVSESQSKEHSSSNSSALPSEPIAHSQQKDSRNDVQDIGTNISNWRNDTDYSRPSFENKTVMEPDPILLNVTNTLPANNSQDAMLSSNSSNTTLTLKERDVHR